MTFMMTQQRTHTICNPKLIAIFALGRNLKSKTIVSGSKAIVLCRKTIVSLLLTYPFEMNLNTTGSPIPRSHYDHR